MRILIAISLVATLLTACVTFAKNPEQQVLDWYEDRHQDIAHKLPSADECHSRAYFYWYVLVAENERINAEINRQLSEYDDMERRSAMLGQHRPELYASLRTASEQTRFAARDGLRKGFMGRAGWTDTDFSYCAGRLAAEQDYQVICPSLTEGPGAWTSHRDYGITDPAAADYGAVEYCMEHSLAPFG